MIRHLSNIRKETQPGCGRRAGDSNLGIGILSYFHQFLTAPDVCQVECTVSLSAKTDLRHLIRRHSFLHFCLSGSCKAIHKQVHQKGGMWNIVERHQHICDFELPNIVVSSRSYEGRKDTKEATPSYIRCTDWHWPFSARYSWFN